MGKQWKQCQTLFLGGSKITADGDCSHEIKRHLLLGRKVMTKLDSILKSRDITWPTKVRLVKSMVFPVVMYGYESWTVKKAEHWRIDAFELWCWRRLLRMDGGWDGWMASLTRWTWVWVNSGSWWWTGRPGVLRFAGSQRVRHDWATELSWNCSIISMDLVKDKMFVFSSGYMILRLNLSKWILKKYVTNVALKESQRISPWISTHLSKLCLAPTPRLLQWYL